MPDFAGALPPTSRIAPATSWHPAVAQKQEDVPMLLSEGGWRRGRDSPDEASALQACAFPAGRPPSALPCVALFLPTRSAAGSRSNPRISGYVKSWRRGRDSNPRGGYKPPTRFPVAFLRPARTPLLTDNPHEKPVSKKMPDFAGALPRSRIAPATSWHPAVAQKHEAFPHAFERRRVAEREGFEPSVQFYPYNRLAGGCLQPARPPLRANKYPARLRRRL